MSRQATIDHKELVELRQHVQQAEIKNSSTC